jgi:hypothetical protein
MTSHDEADAEKQDLTCLMDDRSQRVSQDALERDPTLTNGRKYPAQSGLGEHDSCGQLRDVRRAKHGNADLRLA